MKNVRNVLLSLTILFLTGCATVISGTNQPVTFDSVPQGAAILIDGARVGVTPLTIVLKKSAKSTVMIKMDGYQTVTRDITKSFDGVGVLNIFWDLSTTDAITGAWQKYEPNAYFFELQAKKD
ncbi:MAG: PEGA domain-containing protein [Thalassotalea sp.]